METHAQAHERLIVVLLARGWAVQRQNATRGGPLKVPHVTSADGFMRLWFKKEAVYATYGTHDFGDARSLLMDIRGTVSERLCDLIDRWKGEEAARPVHGE